LLVDNLVIRHIRIDFGVGHIDAEVLANIIPMLRILRGKYDAKSDAQFLQMRLEPMIVNVTSPK
jgi:hypothetical protein